MNVPHTHILTSVPQHDLTELGEKHADIFSYAVSRVFSCWHLRLSRPFTHGRESYRSCLRCGMRRSFDLKNWKSSGRYYSVAVERRSER